MGRINGRVADELTVGKRFGLRGLDRMYPHPHAQHLAATLFS